MSARRVADFDPFATDTVENPYPFYAALRREAPVRELPGGAWWTVTRFDDVQRIALDPESFSSNLVAVLFQGNENAPELVSLSGDGPRAVDVLAIADDPSHARQRKVANKAFSMRRVAAMEPALRSLTDRLIDGFAPEHRGDWMARVAVELPTRIICELVGFPLADRDRLRRWSNDGTALLSGVNTPDDFARYVESVRRLNRYLAARWEEAKRAPGDDVMGELARAALEDAECLSDDEVVAILLQLLSAGSESTTALIGSALMLLLEHPDLQDRLRNRPTLIPAFIEEALRLESPFQGHFRLARKETALAGVTVPEGARLMLLWASANRDEAQFERAEEIDLERSNARAHLAFGFGIHHCIGAALARLEARVALETILARTRRIRVAGGADLRHVPSLFIRRLAALPIEFETR